MLTDRLAESDPYFHIGKTVDQSICTEWAELRRQFRHRIWITLLGDFFHDVGEFVASVFVIVDCFCERLEKIAPRKILILDRFHHIIHLSIYDYQCPIIFIEI